MPTENEWLRLIYVQLTAGGTAGASINQAQVKAAIESAVNIDGLESALASLLTASITQAQIKAAIESAVNIDGLELPIDAANSRIRTNDSWRVRLLGRNSPEFSGANGVAYRWLVPPNREWKFQTGVAVHTAAGTAGNRTVQLSAVNESASAVELYTAGSQLVQTSNTTIKYCFSQHSLPTEVAGYRYNYFPAMVLSAGEELVLSCFDRQTSDYFQEETAFSVLTRNV